MKKLLLVFAILCISACIPVDDFGAYWEKGVVDHALQGKWEEVSSDPAKRNQIQVTEKDGSDQIDSLDKQEREKKDDAADSVRSLKVGPYMYFMAIEQQKPSIEKDGSAHTYPPIRGLVRYEVKEGILLQYSLNDGRMIAFLAEKYPDAKNIVVKKFMSSDSVEIKTLDDEAFKILSKIPDTKEFWKLQGEWRKIK
jgi:hypothetical protein